MPPIFSRSVILLGPEAVDKLKKSTVAVFGLGGVGSYTAEALVRSGIGNLIFVDGDVVSPTNLNRQLIATTDTIGRPKTEVMRERALSIYPEARISVHTAFYLPGKEPGGLARCDYIVDAIDTVSSKIGLAVWCKEREIPIISAMGCGNKLDPARFEVEDISRTSVCPLCRVMRRELKKRGITHMKVVYSKEPPAPRWEAAAKDEPGTKRQIPGSLPFVPSVAGLLLAGQVVLDLTQGLRPKYS